MKHLTSNCTEIGTLLSKKSCSKELHSELRLRRREGTFGERMFLFCGHGHPPGTILMWQGTIHCCCPIWMELTFHPPRTLRSTTACLPREAAWLCAGLRAASSKPCGTLQYWVMAWEFILNTASSGKGKVLATWMGGKWNLQNVDSWLLERNSINFSAPQQSHYNVWTWTVQSKQCIVLSKTILDKSLFGKLKPVKQIDKYKELHLNKG